ncbi:uncharacterized protein LOC124768933 [Schistocerca piceifrons]|uniref:uncharacterized protein LOC124768933 n=1 Tax=Schistocerca piceifrons TaxID=274613 RepID=UPI001F5E48A8|nr:uncharacterized protein LOC124768933 [Schistocerca piceifrons]
MVSVITLDDELLCKYSSFKKTYRILAYALSFANNTRLQKSDRITGPLTPQECHNAIKRAFGAAQHSEYGNEIALLKASSPIPHNSKLRDLHPFVDAEGILRVGGRLMNADVPYDEHHPIIVPPKHHLTRILIIDEHENLLHAGSQLLLAMLRRRFWIPNGRNKEKGVMRKCLKCFRLKSKTAVQLMGQRPAARVSQSHPFQHCGVDYAGPIAVKHGGRRSKVTTKAYIALFICMATKAIHLELVSDLVTSSVLVALRRFIARRGKPSHMYSDNGTTFVGADSELKRFLSNDVTVESVVNFSTSEGISWRLTPPRAPHFGGLWEAGIKCMKSHLKCVIGNAVLTFEELTTVLIQIEACLNSRPLCLLSDDLDSPAALTPGHFLIGQPLCAHPEPSVLEVPANRLHRWQVVQQLHQSF